MREVEDQRLATVWFSVRNETRTYKHARPHAHTPRCAGRQQGVGDRCTGRVASSNLGKPHPSSCRPKRVRRDRLVVTFVGVRFCTSRQPWSRGVDDEEKKLWRMKEDRSVCVCVCGGGLPRDGLLETCLGHRIEFNDMFLPYCVMLFYNELMTEHPRTGGYSVTTTVRARCEHARNRTQRRRCFVTASFTWLLCAWTGSATDVGRVFDPRSPHLRPLSLVFSDLWT